MSHNCNKTNWNILTATFQLYQFVPFDTFSNVAYWLWTALKHFRLATSQKKQNKKQNKTKQNKKQNKTKQNKTKQNKKPKTETKQNTHIRRYQSDSLKKQSIGYRSLKYTTRYVSVNKY